MSEIIERDVIVITANEETSVKGDKYMSYIFDDGKKNNVFDSKLWPEFEEGYTTHILLKKEGKFWNIKEARKLGKGAPSKSASKTSSPDDNLGYAISGAMHDATEIAKWLFEGSDRDRPGLLDEFMVVHKNVWTILAGHYLYNIPAEVREIHEAAEAEEEYLKAQQALDEGITF